MTLFGFLASFCCRFDSVLGALGDSIACCDDPSEASLPRNPARGSALAIPGITIESGVNGERGENSARLSPPDFSSRAWILLIEAANLTSKARSTNNICKSG